MDIFGFRRVRSEFPGYDYIINNDGSCYLVEGNFDNGDRSEPDKYGSRDPFNKGLNKFFEEQQKMELKDSDSETEGYSKINLRTSPTAVHHIQAKITGSNRINIKGLPGYLTRNNDVKHAVFNHLHQQQIKEREEEELLENFDNLSEEQIRARLRRIRG